METNQRERTPLYTAPAPFIVDLYVIKGRLGLRSSPHPPLVLQRFEEELLALLLLLALPLLVKLLGAGGADDEVELGDGDDPRVAVEPVEGDLQGDLPDEAWRSQTLKTR